MWKKTNQTSSPGVKTHNKRLHLDKKQNCPALPQIHLKDEKTSQEIQKQEKKPLRNSISNKKFSLNHKHNTVVPFLLSKENQTTKSFRSLDKMRSQSELFQKEKPLGQRKQSRSRIRIMSKNILGQKSKKCQLHLQQHKCPNQTPSQSDRNLQLKKQSSQYNDQEPLFDWFTTSRNTIFQDNVGNHIGQQKHQSKKFENVGVETDLQMNSQTFKDFIKFKITQKEKYQKLQEVFKFVDDISHQELQKFHQRYQKVKNLCQVPLQTVRQQEINHIIESVQLNETRFLNFMDSFVNRINKVKKNQISQNISKVHHIKQQLNQLKKQINNCFQLKENVTVTKSIEPFTPKNLITPKKSARFQKTPMKSNRQQPQNRNFLSLEIHQKFSSMTAYLTELEMKIKNDQQEITAQLNESRSEFNQVFQTWKFNLQEKNYAIQVCVGDILKLPEMSLSIFGMNRDEDNKDERDILKKIGVFLDNIPEFDEFYSNSDKKKHQDFCFKEVLDFKCLNCAYLKSKMRFIYSKNRELQSVVKILNHLIGHQKQTRS